MKKDGSLDETVPAPVEGRSRELDVVERGHYDVEGEHARGGLGRILRARDRRLGRLVAIKELLSEDPGLMARFAREALVTARLQHPAIVPVYEAGRWPDGKPFYAMKLVEGRSLEAALREAGPLDERLALLLHVLDVAHALAYAHGQGIVHRDLKPANVLCGAFGETVVIDWGLAKDLRGEVAEPAPNDLAGASDSEAGRSVAGAVMGTPAYMPPEQALGQSIDERADVYAIGAILYQLLAGVPPYQGGSSNEVLAQVISTSPVPLEEREPGVPRELATIVAKAMASDRGARYPTAAELAADLVRFQTGQLVSAHSYGAGERLLRWARRHRGPLLVAAAAAVVVAATAVVSVGRVVEERDVARRKGEEAERARLEAEARSDDLALRQAADELERRPTAALAWLGRLSPSFERWEEARVIAADALARGVPARVIHTGGPVRALAAAPDGRTVATATIADGVATVRLWDVASGQSRAYAGPAPAGIALAFSPDGRTLALPAEARVMLWDVGTGAHRFLEGEGAAVTLLAWSPDGASILTGAADGARLTSASTHEGRLVAQGRVGALAFSPDGARQAVAVEGTVLLVPGGEVARHQGAVRDLAFSPDGRTLASAGDDGVVRLIDVGAGRERAALVHRGPVVRLAFAANGALLATAGEDDVARLFDPARGALLSAFTGHEGDVTSLVFAGSVLASAGRDDTVRVWRNGGARVLRGHDGDVTALAIAGLELVSAGDDGRVAFWSLGDDAAAAQRSLPDAGPSAEAGATKVEVVRGEERVLRLVDAAGARRLEGLTSPARRVVLSADGKTAAASTEDGSVRLWDAASARGRTLPARSRTPAPRLAFEAGVLWVEDGPVARMWLDMLPHDASLRPVIAASADE